MWPMEKFLAAERSYEPMRYLAGIYPKRLYLLCRTVLFGQDDSGGGTGKRAAHVSGSDRSLQGLPQENADTLGAAADSWNVTGGEDETLVYPCTASCPLQRQRRFMARMGKAFRAVGTLIHTHYSETMEENRHNMEQTGLSHPCWTAGVLERPVLAAH